MKKSICLYFQVHQPARLRLYRFFDIGKDSHYYDDYTDRTILKRIAQKCYLPMNKILLDAIKKQKGKFKVAFSITGTALEQFDRYAPEVIDSFRALAKTGCVEFLCETYYHSLASLASQAEFEHQVLKHKAAIKEYFGVEPKAFRNTELIYSDSIGAQVHEMGFDTILTEGARHIMGWKSPDYVYNNDLRPEQRAPSPACSTSWPPFRRSPSAADSSSRPLRRLPPPTIPWATSPYPSPFPGLTRSAT